MSHNPNPQAPLKPALEILDPIAWQDQPVPERRWLVHDLIPLRNVCMIAGDGGTGKSQIALQLLIACALGRHWLGRQAMACKGFGVFCEDEPDELHRRVVAICKHYGAELGDLENLLLCSRVGLHNALLTWDKPWSAAEPTDFLGAVINHATNSGAQCVVLDSRYDLFRGGQNDDERAREFIQELRSIAVETEGAVILTNHPSHTGRNTGTGESGSVAWNNAVRSRLYLTKPEGSGRDERVLQSMKANYSTLAGDIRLRWVRGVYQAEDEQQDMVTSLARRGAENVFLECLDAVRSEGREVTDRSRAGNYAPRIFAQRPEANGHDKRKFERAMECLFSAKTIRVENYGDRPSRQFQRIVRADQEALL